MNWLANLRIGTKFAVLIGVLFVGLIGSGIAVVKISTAALLAGRTQSMRAIVETAMSTADTLDKQVQAGTLTKAQAFDQFGKRVMAMTFDKGNGYIYAYTVDGVAIALSDAKLVGTNRMSLKLPNGSMPIKEVIEGIVANPEGYGYMSEFPKPGESIPSTKLAYGILYKPWNIVVGTGVYVDDLKAEISNLTWSAVAIFALLLLVLIGLAVFMAFSVARPLGRLNGVMLRVADGELEAVSNLTDRRDEVGMLARSLEVFKSKGLTARQVEVEAAETRRVAEAERLRGETERQAATAKQAAVVADLAAGLSRLAEGDLTGRVTAFPTEYKTLENDFNAAIATLQETISVIAGNGQGIRSGSGEISQAADDLSRRTEQQAASLEETAAALDEITATVRKTADGAKHANAVVAGAKSDAEASGRVVQDAVAAMSAIEKSSGEISQIIGVIDEIAFQTNLLALNAGVEAARAGEAGRGFAVVASEVRALAQRSAEAAKEIKGLISTSSSQVASGVTLVGETGKALARILAQVSEISGIVIEISASAQEQAVGLQEVNTAVNQMDQMTQQNAAMVEQSTAASHSLRGEAEQLANLIGRFRTGQETAETAAAARSAPARKQAPSRRAVRTEPVVGNLALKPVRDESWEEF